jgi:NTP pyrophosphatase (non-canonical NTP hydrolase)
VTDIDLAAIRRRLERALEFLSQTAPDGVRDVDKTRRAAYILAAADVPALLAEVERLAAERERVERERDGVREELARMAGDLDDARGTLALRDADRDRLRTAYRDLAERTEREHRRLETELDDANTWLEYHQRHAADRDRYRAVVEGPLRRWRAARGRDVSAMDYIAATHELCAAVDALGAAETPVASTGTGEARTAVHGERRGADGAVVCEPCRRGDHESCGWDEQQPPHRCQCKCPTSASVDAWSADEAVSAERCLDLSFASLSQINRQRCQRWHPGFPEDSWTGADWSNAMQGEAGEAGNVVKKLRRAELGTQGALDPPALALRAQLGDEIADTVIYADLLAQFYGLDLALCVARKFNAVSEREGFPERLSVTDATKRGTDGAVPAEPRTVDLSRVRGYLWTDPSGTQRAIPPDEIGVLVADSVPAPAKPRVIVWDWKKQLPLDELRAALDAGLVHLHEVDTQSDECAIVLASAPMGPAAVWAAYEHRDEDYDATKRTWTKPEKCGRCLRPFDPTDTAWNGGARHQDSAWCRSCVDRCHESTDFAHECAVCREATDA